MSRSDNFEAAVQEYAGLNLESALTLHTALLRRGELWMARFGIAETDLTAAIRNRLHELPAELKGNPDIHVAPTITGWLREPAAPAIGIWCGGKFPQLLARDAGVSFLNLICQYGEISHARDASLQG